MGGDDTAMLGGLRIGYTGTKDVRDIKPGSEIIRRAVGFEFIAGRITYTH